MDDVIKPTSSGLLSYMELILNYITTNTINGMRYIGSHTGGIGDKYLGSGKKLLRAIKKYGRASFIKEDLIICKSVDESYKNERWLIELYGTLHPNGYNLSPTGGVHASGGKHHPDTIAKVVKANTGRKLSHEQIERLRKIHTGNKYNLGKKRTPEEIDKMRQAAIKRAPASESTREKISKGNKGKKMTPEQIRKSVENRMKISGYKVSDETRTRSSISHMGQSPANKGKKMKNPPWNKGKTNLLSDDVRRRISESLKAFYRNKKAPDER